MSHYDLVSDYISELTSIKHSLSGGLLKRRFDLTFQRNIFNFLIKDSIGKRANLANYLKGMNFLVIIFLIQLSHLVQ